MKKNSRVCISNMHCSNCSGAIERHFNNLEGINVNVILSDNVGLFTYEETLWDEKKIAKHLKQIGYPVLKDKNKYKDLVKLILCILFTLPFLVHMVMMFFNHSMDKWFDYLQFALATIIQIIAGTTFFKGMIRDFKNKRLGMDVLVSLATLTSYIYSLIVLFFKINLPLYFETCAMLLTILLIGKSIENKAKNKTASSLKSLMSLQEKVGKVKVDNTIVEKNIADIIENELVIISSGEKIPLDGIIIEGNCEIDESMITGESLPVNKKQNEEVLAGTILLSGNITIKVNKKANDTYLSSLIKKVEEIQSIKPKIQKIADKIAGIFVPVVLIISLLTFLITFAILKDFVTSLSRSIATLMISCPCSLGLATPLSILVGSSRAIKMGIIYNNTEIFEKANNINAICFDKTGTLSEGKFEVISYNSNKENALDIIYSLEVISNHPIAKALVTYCLKNNAKLINLNAKEIVGKGIVSDNYFIYKENECVYLKENNDVIATIIIKDKIKDNAKQVINNLKRKTISVYMFTGDNKKIALNTANELNIDTNNVFYEIKPEDKLSLIEKLQKNGHNVAFVGDGINDALALNKANLSIAMGQGTDVAKNSSDITLSNNNLNNIYSAVLLSKKVYKKIIENFMWAFSYNLIAIPLAMLGILSPLIAGICMSFSSIMVVLNALRLYKVKVSDSK